MARLKIDGHEFECITDPFRAWVLDHALGSFAEDLLAKFPEANDDWYVYGNQFEIKRATDNIHLIPPPLVDTLLLMNSHVFVETLEKLTGIKGIISDPWFRGGGLHQIYKGGKLDIHADFNWHGHLKLDRRLNVLLYLNKDWKPEYGGELELWAPDMSRCVRKIEPKFNRLVIFETTDNAYHGHPNPWTSDTPRRSLAWYFYTNGRPEHEKNPAHSTLFKKRPDEETSDEIEAFREKRNKGRVV